MDRQSDVEIRALREVIDAVEERLRRIEAAGAVIPAARSEVYAAAIYAVIASARESGHHGSGSIAQAPLLDEILAGAEVEHWETAIYARIGDRALTR